ncbi:TonB family protein [Termitidicoccus mucosus]|uniref:energy transducer TonB n=3 Tax=Termitidicoccus mucosus TaxID=1184151 RepID=UPI0031843E4F
MITQRENSPPPRPPRSLHANGKRPGGRLARRTAAPRPPADVGRRITLLRPVHEKKSGWKTPLLIALALHASLTLTGFFMDIAPAQPPPSAKFRLAAAANGEIAAPSGGAIEIEWLPAPAPEPAVTLAPSPAPEPEPQTLPEPPPEPETAPDFKVPVSIETPEPPPPPEEKPEPALEPIPEVKTLEPAPELAPAPRAVETPPPAPEASRPEQPVAAAAPASATPARALGQPNAHGTDAFSSGGDNDESAVVIDNKNFTRPPYPYEARRNGYTGAVIIAIRVENGRIVSTEIRQSSGYVILDEAAAKWVRRQWKFPREVTRLVVQPFEFRLANKKSSSS